MGVSKLTCWSTMSWFSGLSRTTLVLLSPWIPPGMTWLSWFRDADMMILSWGLQKGATELAGTGSGVFLGGEASADRASV